MRKKNTFFQFKQFRIDQGQTAMKVTTEGCILGAWVARQSQSVKKVLDIGAGTGLLSLMIAQEHSDVHIDAVELNEQAARQALENFLQSPWNNRLKLHNGKVQDLEIDDRFDLIVSNPPFFNQSLNSPAANVNLARHDDSLSQQDLITAIKDNLTPTGHAYILYPEREADTFRQVAAQSDLYAQSELKVFNSPGSRVFRKVIAYGFEPVEVTPSVLIIKDGSRQYTADFVELLDDYYLYLGAQSWL